MGVVVIVVARAAVGLYFAFVSIHQVVQSSQVTVQNASWQISYQGATSGYLTSSDLSCHSCPLTGFVGSTFLYSLYLTNSNGTTAHTILNVTVQPPFSIVSTFPSVPFSIDPAHSASLTLTIERAVTPGTYTLYGTIVAA